MRGKGWFGAAIAAVALVACPRPAAADSMDPALARLVTNGSCRTAGPNGGLFYNPQSGFNRCSPDDAAFAKLIAQYGFAIAPTAMHTARTTGYGGFEMSIEAAYTAIDADADYWKLGTQGPQEPTSKNFSVANRTPDKILQVYSAKLKKGLPFGFEITGTVGYMANTSIVTGGADIRWSLFEGFGRGIPNYFPEISGGGSVRTITGTSEFQLTVVGVDGRLSKGIPVGGAAVITPYASYQWLRIFGDSGLIDMTPNTDAVSYCDFKGTNTPATPDPNKTDRDGQPVCGRGSSADFNNTAVFAPVRLTRHRVGGGLNLRVQMIKFGAQFMIDAVSPEDANQGADYELPDPKNPDVKVNKFKDVAQQWTLSFDLGAVF